MTKQYLGLVDPAEDLLLPDIAEVRDARRKVGAVDELIRLGKQGEATRRFRELSGGTWDLAIDATRHWRELGLLEKLDRFGWRPKGHADDPAGRAGHPLHDPSLDG